MIERVLLVTCADWPSGEPGYELLDAALAARGIASEWVGWDDPDVDWTDGLAVVRSTWDYAERLDEFLAWSRSVPWLLNGSSVFAWNTDKRYLVELAEQGLPVVPTLLVSDADSLAAARASYAVPVTKPCVGANGVGVAIGDAEPGPGPWVVQPLVESVRSEGETSVFVFDGRPVTQFRKVPAAGEIRVHEHLGGVVTEVCLDAEATRVAIELVEGASDLLERDLAYARVDLMRLDTGELMLSELEVTEPGLYLDCSPTNAGLFADLVQNHL
jgi:glutathione synthase/RimK-type ligase-like ATP-grasp enzyme